MATKYKILLDILEIVKKTKDETKIREVEQLVEKLEEIFAKEDECKSSKCRL